MDSKYRSRKFGLAVASWVAAQLWLYAEQITGESYVQLIFAILAMYAAGSVGDKVAQRGVAQ